MKKENKGTDDTRETNFNRAGLNIREACEYTGIGQNTMRDLVKWGKIPILRIGRTFIIRREVLDAFITVNQGRNLRNEADVLEMTFDTDLH